MPMRKWRLAYCVLAFATGIYAGQSCLAPEAIWRMRSVSDPQISQDGKSILYVLSWNDQMDDAAYSNLWQVDAHSGVTRAITEGKVHDNNPRWSPDGSKVAYLSNRAGKQEIRVRSIVSGEDRVVLGGVDGASNLAWSPDGKLLAYLAFVPTEPGWAPKLPVKPAGAAWAPPPVVLTDLRWTFDGVGVLKPGGNRIFVVPVDGGAPRQISGAPYQHTFYVGDMDLAWSQDSQSVLAPAVEAPDGWGVYEGNQIYAFPIDGTKPRQLTNFKGYGLQMRPSPDGSWIAFTGYDWKGYSYHVSKLRIVKADGSGLREITTQWDRDVANPIWSPDSKRIRFLSDDHGDLNLYETGLDGAVRQITSGRQRIASVSMSGETAALVYSTPTTPAALGILKPGSGKTVRLLMDPNREQLTGCAFSNAEEIVYPSFDGRKIQGWVLKPSHFDPSRKYPLLLSIHGGPHGAYGDSFNFDLQMFAGRGFVVLYTNPRGSTGYGQEFGNIIQHKWPGDDIKDIFAGADFVIGQGYIDPARTAVIGGSGGGLMTSWIIGQTDRFRAAVALYPVTNWFTHVGSGDNGFYIASVYRKGMPWDYPEDYITHSPLFFAKNFKTPTLIVTGEEDWRTPIAQSQELFRALKVRGVDTALVRVPGESHGIRKRPSHQIDTLVYSLAWLDRYIPQ